MATMYYASRKPTDLEFKNLSTDLNCGCTYHICLLESAN